MKYLRYVVIVLALTSGIGLASTNCGPPKTVVTPQGQAAWGAQQILTVVHTVQTTAIQASRQGALADADAVPIVQACVSIEKTLQQVPSGWQATVTTAWKAAKAKLSTSGSAVLQTVTAAVDVALASIGGGL